MKKYFNISIITFLLLFSNCSGDSPADPKINVPDTSLAVSEHFSFQLYDGLSETISTSIINKLEENYTRVLGDLNLSSINKVTVKIWNDEAHFLDDMLSALGVKYPGAAGYVYGPTDIRILYRGNSAQNTLHEFCHAASLAVNNRFGNNPRWFWEAVAIYESGELRDPKTISYLVSGNFPTIAELNSDYNLGNYKIYEVGYLLSEYIINSAGKNAYVNLIKSNGNIQQTLGVTTQQFEAGWKQYIQNKYMK